MAEETETILLDIKFEAGEAIKRQLELKAAQEALRKEQAELNKIMKEGGDGARAAAEQYINNEAQLKNLSSQVLNNSKVIQANNQDVAKGGSAYRQLSDAYLFAAAKAKDMAAAYGVNSVEAKKATEEAFAMNKQLKEIDASVGQHNRNVGNYMESIKSLQNTLDKVTKEYKSMSRAEKESSKGQEMILYIKDTKEELQGLQKEMNGSVENMGQFQNSIQSVIPYQGGMITQFSQMIKVSGGVGPVLKMATNSVIALGKQLWVLVSNPIVAVIAALVLAVTALFKAFKSTDAGATALDGVFKALGNVVDVVIDRVASLVTLLKNLITFNWGELKSNAQDTFGGIGDSIKDAAAAGWEYAHAMDAIKDREAASLIRSAKLRKEIEDLKNQAKDQTQTQEERLAANEAAMQKSIELNGIEIGFLKERNQAEIENLAAKVVAYGTTVEERAEMVLQWIELDDREIESMREKDAAFADFYNKNETDIQNLQKLRADEYTKETELITKNRELLTEQSGLRKQLQTQAAAAAKKASDDRKKAAEEAFNVEKNYAEKSLELFKLRASVLESNRLTDVDYFSTRMDLINDTYILEKRNIEKYTKDEEEKKVKLTKLAIEYNADLRSLFEQRANAVIRYAQIETELIRLNREAELVGAKLTAEQVMDLALDNAKIKADADRLANEQMLSSRTISEQDAANETLRIDAELRLATAQAEEAFRVEQADKKREADEFIAAVEYDTEMARLNNKFASEQTFLKMEMDAEIEAARAKIQNAEDQEAAILAIKEKYAEYSKALKKEENNFMASATADLFGSLAQLNEEDEEKSKAYAKIQIIISTAQAMMAAYAQGSKYSIFGGVLAAGAALTAGIASYANVDKKTMPGSQPSTKSTTSFMPNNTNNGIVQGNSGFSQTQAVQQTISQSSLQAQPVLILPHLTAAQDRAVTVANRNGL